MVNYSYNSKTSGLGPSWYHTDHLGSTNLLTDENGDVIQHTEYYPYGETRVSEGEEITQYKFTGQEFDPETGLYYYVARYYDPVIARFISADSIVPDTYNPQDFNRYTYVRNNPIVYSDPTGHFIFAAMFVGAWLSGVSYAATADNASFSGLLESMFIGAAQGVAGAAAGAGTIALLGKAGFVSSSLGGDLLAGALAGAPGGVAAYSAGVALTGGQWEWKGFGMSAGIGSVAGGIAGYYKSAHLKKYRGKYETFWGKRLINPTGGQIRGLDDWGAGHWWADRRADGVWYPHRAIDIEGVVGQEVKSPITGFYTKVAVGTRNEGVLIVGTFRGEPVALKILHFNVNLSGTSGLITAGDPMGTLMDLGQYYARITPHVHIKMFVNYNVVNPTEYFFP